MAKAEQKAGAGKAGKNKKFKKRERKNVPFLLLTSDDGRFTR